MATTGGLSGGLFSGLGGALGSFSSGTISTQLVNPFEQFREQSRNQIEGEGGVKFKNFYDQLRNDIDSWLKIEM